MRRRVRSRVRDAIEVRSPSVDAERLLRALEANLAAHRRRPWTGYIPSFDDLIESASDSTAVPRSEMEYYLHRVRLCDVSVTPDVRASSFPIVGPIFDLLKRQFHHLVLYYVNILAGKQAHYNAHMLRVVTLLSRETHRLRAELDRMKTGMGGMPPEKHGKS
ncbi:MAG: hypothetical protein HYX92_03755 [Chloroflexi bacterium]|nr:hypothetical protein [Chloroflexota bacterium]